jgi:hypothetical protein
VLLRIAALALLASALAACGGSEDAANPASEFPPGCTIPEVDRIVNAFLSTPSFAPPSQFRRYASVESDKRSFRTTRATAALAHLRRRHALGERDRLIALRVSNQDFNHVGISFQLTRFAPDFSARGIRTRLATGSGTIDCAHQKVAAWAQNGP